MIKWRRQASRWWFIFYYLALQFKHGTEVRGYDKHHRYDETNNANGYLNSLSQFLVAISFIQNWTSPTLLFGTVTPPRNGTLHLNQGIPSNFFWTLHSPALQHSNGRPTFIANFLWISTYNQLTLDFLTTIDAFLHLQYYRTLLLEFLRLNMYHNEG